MELTITPKAVEKIKEALALEGKLGYGLRLTAQESGCGCGEGCGCGGGVAYGLYPDLQAQPEDTVIQQQGLQLFVDQASKPLVEGATIDFVSHPERGEGFLIERPQKGSEPTTHTHAEGECECGGSCNCH
jgi:iron-sulfur cluster assembly accessory protein